MNTKILFYCTHLENGEFTKIVFETILPGDSIQSLEDACDWMDENISKHYDDFSLDIVFDWVMLLYKPTLAAIKDTEIIKTISGRLVFDDERRHNTGTSSAEKPKKTHKTAKKDINKTKDDVTVKKEYPSVWIEPDGTTHHVAFANHNEFASDWLEENDPEEFEKHIYSVRYCYEILQERGWIRILGWTNPPSFVIPSRISPNQKDSLRSYCISNDVPYNSFPEILKS